LLSCKKENHKNLLENSSIKFTEDIAMAHYYIYCFENFKCTDKFFRGFEYPEGFDIGSTCDTMYIPKIRDSIDTIQLSRLRDLENNNEVASQFSNLFMIIQYFRQLKEPIECIPMDKLFNDDMYPIIYSGIVNIHERSYEMTIDLDVQPNYCFLEEIELKSFEEQKDSYLIIFKNSTLDMKVQLHDSEYLHDSNDYFGSILIENNRIKI